MGNLTGGSVTYSNNLEKIETIRDDGLIEGADPTIAALTGKVDVRFADTTLIDLAAGGTPVDLEFAYTLSALAKLVLTAHEVYTIDAVSGDLFIAFNGLSRTAFGRLDPDTLQLKSWYRIGLFTPGRCWSTVANELVAPEVLAS